MRAMKKTVSVLLSLVLVIGVLTIGISAVGAAENYKIEVSSNIASTVTKNYSADSETVTVTFELQSAKNIISADAVLTYDPAVLKFASSNTAASICPVLSTGQLYMANTTKTDGRLPFNASDLDGFDFKNKAVFVTVVFDILSCTGNTTVNLEVKCLGGSTTVPAKNPSDEFIIIEDDENDTTAYTATATEKVTPDADLVDPSVFLRTYMGNFEGKVGLVHFFNRAPAGYNASDLTIKFSGPIDEYNKTMSYSELPISTAKLFRYDYFVYAAMFAEPITWEIYQGDKLIATKTYSIEQYILDKLPDLTNTNQIAFYKAVLNYGGYAQIKFDYNTSNLANKSIDSALTTVDASSITVPGGVGESPDLTSIGISKKITEYGEYLDDTRIRIFYKVTDASKLKDATVNGGSVDNVKSSFEKVNNTTYQLIVPNIAAALLDEVQTVTFSNGAVYKTTMMARVKDQLSDTTLSTNDRNFFTALYWYNQTANAFFGK